MLQLHVPNVGVVVVIAGATTKVEVGSMTKTAHIKHMTVLNGTTIETRIGIGIQGAEGTGRIVAIQCLADGLGTIVVDAYTVIAHRSTTPRTVESHVLRAVNVIHVGGDHEGGFIHAVIVNILFVAGNKANCGNKKGNCYQT
jgi:hypothetical protein